ncbi:MAG: NAD(P)/FAD-dependent oxidoreductase [Betaproteobacteria bacterium]
MSEHIEKTGAIVIGAGVVGLACARALARQGIETIILERHADFGQETSSRNSEVIHAGLYYPDDTLKARLCVEGNRQLYEYAAVKGIPHQRCGKLIVATGQQQEERLHALQAQAERNGIGDTQMLSQHQAEALEPQLRCVAALHSPSTGIISSHDLMLALLGDAEANGALLSLNSEVISGEISPGQGNHLLVESGGERMLLAADVIINAAGLSAVALARRLQGCPPAMIPSAYFAKGNYYALAGKAPFSRLVYPVPEPGGLGVHLTLDLGGQARFGPDVEWIETLDYTVDPKRADAFYAEVRKYWPALPDHSLAPAYCGIRPKITGPQEANADFLIQCLESHGLPGLINLFGIESPGLTACLSIADQVCRQLGLPD